MRKLRTGWWFDVLLVILFIAITAALALRTPLLSVDLAVRDLVDAHRPAWAYWLARVFNFVGQGGVLLTPVFAFTAFLVGRRIRSVRPAGPVIVGFVLTDVTVGPLKLWTDRLAASAPKHDHPEYVFHAAEGVSYPSGHVVNAIVWYCVVTILLARWLTPAQRRAIRYLAPAIVVGTTTYLSFHWLTDGMAAVCVGVLLNRILDRIPWDAIPLPAYFVRRGLDGPMEVHDSAEVPSVRL